MCLSE